ncbi:MAG TPA: hypothetical protein VER12_02660 [Polyangiaceae bacterium]|nr:hypothetical protein [Polyangiaceae bacterium]
MTRAKPKPTIAAREPAPKQRTANAVTADAVPVKAAPAKTKTAKSAPVKGVPNKAVVGNTDAAKATTGKASATNGATPRAATSKTAASQTATSKASKRSAAAPKTTPLVGSVAAKAAPAKPVAAKAESGKRSALLDTPAKIRPIEQAVGVSSDAVARRTGKSWAQWFALLDAAGAAELDHKGIVAVLAQRHGVGPWWQQMVTVAYEQARGKNGNAATDEGFQVDVSKVLELPLAKLFRFWAEPSERNKWLADDRFSIHKATASKSIRARWGRGVSRIDVDFCEKGPTKSQVTVQHNRIETSDAAEQMKAYWAKKIRALEALTRP